VRVLFDCRYVRFPRHDGISRFSAELVRAFAAIHPVTMVVHDERQLAMLPEGVPWVRGPHPERGAEPFASLLLNRHRPDVVYSPMQTIGALGRRFRLVTTVHDLIYYENPEPPRNLSLPVRALWRLYHLGYGPERLLLRFSDAHVTVSHTTERLMREHRLTRHPISVVYNGVAPTTPGPGLDGRGDELVYMGSFMPYKNVELLARALHGLPGYRLHLLSAIADSDRARLTALAPQGALVIHGGVTDAEYRAALDGARALVTASRAEGFGIPLIEAMAAGTPVIATDIPVFREVGADAVHYVDPDSAESVVAAVRALEGREAWERARARGLEESARFRWDRSARALLDALEAAHAGGAR
jgi:glycosyltransferase involved in cell wall biosynthesis